METNRSTSTAATPALLFVYNADGGLVNGLLDAAHKAFSPATYGCNLCALTYGPLAMKPSWRRFLGTLPGAVDFLHRDEFRLRYRYEHVSLPAVFQRQDDGALSLLLSAETLNAVPSLVALQSLVRQRLEAT